MKKTEIHTTTIETEVVQDILCNKCGLSLVDENFDNFKPYFKGTYDCGYGSKLVDGNTCNFDLCEDCLVSLFNSFKIPISIKTFYP